MVLLAPIAIPQRAKGGKSLRLSLSCDFSLAVLQTQGRSALPPTVGLLVGFDAQHFQSDRRLDSGTPPFRSVRLPEFLAEDVDLQQDNALHSCF